MMSIANHADGGSFFCAYFSLLPFWHRALIRFVHPGGRGLITCSQNFYKFPYKDGEHCADIQNR